MSRDKLSSEVKALRNETLEVFHPRDLFPYREVRKTEFSPALSFTLFFFYFFIKKKKLFSTSYFHLDVNLPSMLPVFL